ncbi:MAG: VTC domain-containing protein [Desulfofustis sp.]
MDSSGLTKVLEEKGEFELKYTFPHILAHSLEGWLAISCMKDEKYPESRVQSIYLEAADARSYQEKINSDFFKTKFRVRWYETEDGRSYGDADQTPVFLEKKMKVGSKRLKIRWTSSTVFSELKNNSLNSAFHGSWYRQFSEQTRVSSILQPFIQVSYSRKRFIDPSTGIRISLDCNIKVERTNSQFLPPPPNLPLNVGVFEIKGKNDQPPSMLAYLTSNIVTKDRFSKYERCLSSLET